MENIPANDMGWVLVFRVATFSFPGLFIDISSWRLLLCAEIETPQDFQGRNVSVSAESSTQVLDGCMQGNEIGLELTGGVACGLVDCKGCSCSQGFKP